MKHFGLLCGIYVAAVLETDPASWRTHTGISVCPLYLVACIAAWTGMPLRALLWGAGIGLIADALGTDPPGIQMTLVATVAWWAARLRVRHEWRSLPAFGLFAVALVGVLSPGSWLIHSLLFDRGMPTRDLLLSSAGSAFATGLCGLLIRMAGRALSRAARSLAAPSY